MEDSLFVFSETKRPLEEIAPVEPKPKRKKVDDNSVFLDGQNVALDKIEFLLSPKILAVLEANDIEELFPVQNQGHDVAVCAPTGSGKTLAYAIPVLNELIDRVVCRLRCIVLLPTKDLAQQVFRVFQSLCKSTPLKVEVIYGQFSLDQEQARLMKGPESRIDILVTTPGRLVEHLRNTPGFTLHHLRYLVVDEADRLQMESFQGWLEKSLQSASAGRSQSQTTSRKTTPLQKLLFSATLTQNPRKIANLQLNNPKFFTAAVGRYKVPDTLKEFYIKCQADEKPAVLLSLLASGWRRIVCFTASVESTHRLAVLLHALAPKHNFTLAEYSGSLSQNERKAVLAAFEKGKTDLLVCSDMMTRGMDLTTVKLVVNYDVPPFIKTYLHRVGRTARAGNEGTAVTLALRKEMYHFKQNLAKADNSKLQKMKVDQAKLIELKRLVRHQLPDLRRTIFAEEGKATFARTDKISAALLVQARANRTQN